MVYTNILDMPAVVIIKGQKSENIGDLEAYHQIQVSISGVPGNRKAFME